MSQLSDYVENKLVDMIRGQAWSLSATLYYALASAASDSAVTELSGTGYARVSFTRDLTNWSGTQGPGTTAASSGTTHITSNNVLINWGTAGSAWGTANYVVIYDASTGGNIICYLPLPAPVVIATSDPVSIAIAGLNLSFGATGGCSDYLSNKLIDFIFRGQAFTFPATMYSALFTAVPNNAGGGTEVGSAIGYSRVSYSGSLANWAGTQGAGTTVASTGTAGLTSNNAAVTFGSPTGSWGTLGWTAWFDASTSGNLLFWAPLTSSKTVASGAAPPTFAIASNTITFA
jgi:hypothetical protein